MVVYIYIHYISSNVWTILGSSMVVYIYIQVMLWTILGSSMVVYIYIQ